MRTLKKSNKSESPELNKANDFSKIKILISRHFPETGINLLEKEGFSLTIRDTDVPMTKQELIEIAKDHNALMCTLTEKIDSHFLRECCHLDIISQFAVGYDNIDIKTATDLGIPVGYTPGAMSEATAETAFGLMIAVSRKMIYLHKTILRGEWKYFCPTANLGIELKGKTLGIFGLGRIGMIMAKKCKAAYEMNVIYNNRSRNTEAENDLNASFVSFEELLQESDIISVHCVLNDKTKEIFNKEAFAKMKEKAIFINTSRGLVHNEKDLIEALEKGVIWGAGLDVTNPEPMQKDNPLLSMENVAVVPHIGSGTVEARSRMSVLAAQNIIEFYKNNRVPNLVNPEVM